YSFEDMVGHALNQEDSEVYVKLHPETIAGAKGGNLTSLGEIFADDRIHLLRESCNIVSLLKQVDEVYVMTSGVGLEALLAGKKVTCFGVPFYSGWGLTTDMVAVCNPRRKLPIESLFA